MPRGARPRGLTPSPVLSGSPALLLAGAAGLALGLSPFAGGFYASSIWAPAGLGLLAVLTAVLIAQEARLPRSAIAVVAAIAALGLLSLASALWTDSIEQAVVEGNRLLVYATALALLVVLLRTERAAAVAFAAFAVGALLLAAWVLAGMLRGDETLFLLERLNEPLGYINGQANFFVLAVWPCLALAERRGSGRAAAPLAGLGLAGVTLFGGLAVLGQSRGAILAAAVTGIVVLVLVAGRLRRTAALLVAAGCLAPAITVVLDVYRESADADRLPGAAVALVLASMTAGAIWAVLVALERRGRDSGLRPRRVVAIGVTALAVLAAAVALASAERISGFVDRQYDAFVTLGNPQGDPSTSRLATGAGNRYDYWRVAVEAWREHPLAGVGAGGYDKPYFAQRSTPENIRQPHSLELQILAELGIVGAILLGAALLLTAAAAWRAISARGREPAILTALGVLTTWFVHTSVDWMHLLPGLTGVALLGVAVLVRPAATAGDEEAHAEDPRTGDAIGRGPTRPRRARLLPALIVGAAIAVAAISLSRQSLAERYVQRAQDALADNPERALVEANRALRFDREAISAYYAKSAALARFGDGRAARAVLVDAARREPHNFVTWVLRGDLSVRRGDLRAAGAEYGRAARLNPRDPSIAAARNAARRGVTGP